MIYFIQSGDSGPIKIGYTASDDSMGYRAKMLQTGSWEKLTILATTLGSRAD